MSKQKESPLTLATNLVYAVEQDFGRVLSDPRIQFAREAEFAVQHLSNNEYLTTTAKNNPASLQNAVINVAALGISLNPARKHAYLVPRKIGHGDNKRPAVCLDISYQGMIHIAIDSGAVVWAQCKLVYEGDQYENQGLTLPPVHVYQPFARNRSIAAGLLGVYVVVRLSNGDFLTHEMDADSVLAIRDRSESYKAGKASPWKTDFGEMAKKTCVKQAQKYWPKNDRLSELAHYLDTHGEGIDFSAENAAGGPPSDLAMALVEQAHDIAKATDSGSMAAPWAELSKRIKDSINQQKVPVQIFAQCRDIVAARAEELKQQAKQDEARTVETTATEVKK